MLRERSYQSTGAVSVITGHIKYCQPEVNSTTKMSFEDSASASSDHSAGHSVITNLDHSAGHSTNTTPLPSPPPPTVFKRNQKKSLDSAGNSASTASTKKSQTALQRNYMEQHRRHAMALILDSELKTPSMDVELEDQNLELLEKLLIWSPL